MDNVAEGGEGDRYLWPHGPVGDDASLANNPSC